MTDVLQFFGCISLPFVAVVVSIILDDVLRSPNKYMHKFLRIVYYIALLCVWVCTYKIVDNIS